jgi:hypothetical protein
MRNTRIIVLWVIATGLPAGWAAADPQLPGMLGSPKVPADWTAADEPQRGGYPARFFPFIDTFGQYIHADWPGKTHQLSDLQRARAAEEADLASHPGPSDWDHYGGWRDGPTLPNTGYFHVQKFQGKWWLIDPEGKLFWSHGIDGVRFGTATPIDGREAWFQDFPGAESGLSEFYGKADGVIRDYYRGRHPATFDFALANLKRKYGSDWPMVTAVLAHRRLRSWDMNTLGNWSDPTIHNLGTTPYVEAIHFASKPIAGSNGAWDKFRDVFDPDFRAQLQARMAQEAKAGESAGDPWCIGYFVDNEISWGDDTSLAVAVLLSPATQAAKAVLIDDLIGRYGSIAALNAVWGSRYNSWQDLRATRREPDRRRAAEDLRAFNRRIVETYFQTVRDVVMLAAPHHLYLGCRFAGFTSGQAVEAAARYCDVLSANVYRPSPEIGPLVHQADKPVIIGEFHFGALDRGLFHAGLAPVADQAQRAKAYTRYVTDALNQPNIVGAHWFLYRDEPVTGRTLDGENCQVGFVDVCDAPYPELIDACRRIGAVMYQVRAGGPLARAPGMNGIALTSRVADAPHP